MEKKYFVRKNAKRWENGETKKWKHIFVFLEKCFLEIEKIFPENGKYVFGVHTGWVVVSWAEICMKFRPGCNGIDPGT